MGIEASVAELTTVLARMQGMLLSQEAATSAAEQLSRVARELIGPAAGAGVSLLEQDGNRMSTAATDAVVEASEELQHELGEGPCLSAWAMLAPQRIDDTAEDRRWPGWSRAVQDLGVRSVLNAPLVFHGEPLGAMEVYATTAHAFSADDERTLALLAGAAATFCGAAQGSEAPHRLSAALKAALRDRQTIDMAAGMLMERRGLNSEAARGEMLEASRAQGRPLAVIARQVLDHPATPATGRAADRSARIPEEE